jgi:hypothetical protein
MLKKRSASPSKAPISNRLAPFTPLLIGAGAALVLIGCLALLLGVFYFAAPKIVARLPETTPMPCGQPKLAVGELTLQIETISLNPDGRLPDIPKKAGIAYWTGTQPHYIFLLPQVRQNLEAFTDLKAGDTLVITSADCSQGVFAVKAVEPREAFLLEQVDPGASGATLVLPMDPAGTVMVVSGVQVELTQVEGEPARTPQAPAAAPPGRILLPMVVQEQQGGGEAEAAAGQEGNLESITTPVQPSPTLPAEVQPSATPPPESTAAPQPTATPTPEDTPVPTETFIPMPTARGGVEAEIGFLEKQVTAGKITLRISVYNYGAGAFTLYKEDVRLLPPGGGAVALTSASPNLPEQVSAGETQAFTFTFPNPGGSGIVFQIFNVEFNLDDF